MIFAKQTRLKIKDTAISLSSKKNRRILFSARDTAAALFIAPIIEAARRHPSFEPYVVAQGLAIDILSKTARTNELIIIDRNASDVDELSEIVDTLLHSLQPKYVVTSLSSPRQVGVDEVLVRQAVSAGIHSISTVQDFWGECNFISGSKPHRFFVQDVFAKIHTEARHKVPCVVVGSTRHDRYCDIDPPQLRDHFRKTVKADEGKIITFFGQALHSVKGYHEHLLALGRSVEGQFENAVYYYRPHPRETYEETRQTLKLLNHNKSRFVLTPDIDLETLLCGSDVSISMFSNCLYDAAYLNRISNIPVTLPVSAILSAELLEALTNDLAINIDELPYASTGIAVVIRPSDSFNLSELVNMDSSETVWKNASEVLEQPGKASLSVLEHLLKYGGP